MSAKDKKTQWLIHPIGSYNNKVVTSMLGLSPDAVDTRGSELRDEKGKPIFCYELPDRKSVLALLKSKADLNLDFIVYNQRWNEDFVRKSRLQRTPKTKLKKRFRRDPHKIPGVTTLKSEDY